MEKSWEAAEYFRGHQGYHRLLLGMREKYNSLGRLGGTVQLSRLKEEERDALEGLLQRSYGGQKSAAISVERFHKALQESKFAGCDLEKVLEIYFGGKIVSKREERDEKLREQELFFGEIYEEFKESRAGEWFRRIMETGEMPFTSLLADYHRDKEAVGGRLRNILKGLNRLPVFETIAKRLAMFAAEITANPHFFDEGEKAFSVFLYGVCDLLEIEYPRKRTAEVKAEILYQAGLIKDDISNFAVCMGIRGWMKINGKEHEGMSASCAYGEPQQISLYHLSNLNRLQGEEEQVLVVENPTVFMDLLERRNGRASLVCGNGQPNLAVLILLDKIVDSGGTLYYSGDFDPEGLLIAQRLKLRYGENLVLWHYEREDYERAKSGEVISKERMRQLNGLTAPKLREVGNWLEESGMAGYQELLTGVL